MNTNDFNKAILTFSTTIILIFFTSALLFSNASFLVHDTLTHYNDSSKADTSLLHKKAKKPDIDDPVQYAADDSFYYDIASRKVFLYGNAKVHYQNIDLTASYIEFDMEHQSVYACGVKDTAGVLKGIPHFKEGSEEFDAQWLRYNFKTRKAFVYFVTTKQEGGKLIGDSTKRTPNGHVHLKGAKYSTCDLDHPHFYIGLTKAKAVPNDKIVSGPAYFVVADIPLPLLIPFGFFPNAKGYSSGILFPSWGEEPNRGFYLREGGYYFGISDNMDARLTGDIFSNGSWRGNLITNYKRRYKFAGNLQLNYAVNKTGEEGTRDYAKSKDFRFTWSHSQDGKASPNSSFSASVNLSSQNYDKINSYDAASYLTNTKSSSISYSRSWPNSPFRLTTAVNHSQNSNTGDVNMTLPQTSLSMNTLYPFRRKDAVGEMKWYENIQIGYSASLDNKVKTKDSLFLTSHMFDKMKNGYKHDIPISTNFKLTRFINLTPAIQYRGMVYTESVRYTYLDSVINPYTKKTGWIDTTVTHGVQYAHSYYPSVSLGYNPKIYGMFMFKNSRLKAIRHVMSPFASVGFTPDVSKFVPNYYHSYTNAAGKKITYSEFDGSLYGSPSLPPGKSASMSFGLRNNFEAKYLPSNDSTGKDEKVQLLENLDFQGSYNFMAEEYKLSYISMNTGTHLFSNKFNIRFDAQFDPYALNGQGKRINQFAALKNGKLARLTAASVSMGTSFSSGGASASTQSTTPEQPQNIPGKTENESEFVSADVNYDIPWSLSVDYQWSYSKPYLLGTITQSMNFSGDLSVTKKWKVGFRSGYDFVAKDLTFTTVNISRDLHCWDMRFSWVPFGYRSSYNFTINARASLLKDLKYNKRSDWRDNF